MSKKTIDTSSIVNELEGASAYFKRPSTPKVEPESIPSDRPADSKPSEALPVAEPMANPEPEPRLEEPQTTTDVRPYARTENIRIKRTITRYAFEFFQDQIESLKRFSLDEQLQGEKGSMSQMVREAIDSYIAKRKRLED